MVVWENPSETNKKTRLNNMKDKVIWITGASSGIGEALVYELANAGAKLIISSRNRDELFRVKQKCRNQIDIHVLSLDLEDNLVNSGTGKNYGVELTVEKFFSNGYYGLFTSSIYDSKYTASDDIERNTAFNGKYVLNILAGKEWKVGAKKINKFSIDVKFTNAGGRAYTPIDLAASMKAPIAVRAPV